MKKVTAVLLVYAIIVIASCVFWVWSAFSKSRPTAETNDVQNKVAADADKIKQDAGMATDKAIELTGGVMEDVIADSQARRNREFQDL